MSTFRPLIRFTDSFWHPRPTVAVRGAVRVYDAPGRARACAPPDEGSACSTKGRWPPERLVGTNRRWPRPSSPPTTSLQKMHCGAVRLPWHRRALAFGPASQVFGNTAVFGGVSIAGPRPCPEGRTERAVARQGDEGHAQANRPPSRGRRRL